ncbi:Ankyrin repeat protein [Rickettsiales bacterium Ac37b]|nr:Ankyrin repeat protein [Rickettsiales bacterium Ac37b]
MQNSEVYVTQSDSFRQAVRNNNIEEVKEFINKGASVNEGIGNGMPVLHIASYLGHLPMIELLLDNSASIDAKCQDGKTAVHWAIQAVRRDKRTNNIEVIKLLLNKGASIDIRDDSGRTPFHYCILYKNIEGMRLLFKKEFDLTVAGENGMVPLHYAIRSNNKKAVQFLLSEGANIHAIDKDGKTALHYAAWNGDVKNIELLIDNGANVNAIDKEGKTALHYSTSRGDIENVELLLDKGAKIDARDINDTPLHIAIRENHREGLRLLIDKEVNLNARAKYINLSLKFAFQYYSHNRKEIINMLVAKGEELITKVKQKVSEDLYKELQEVDLEYTTGKEAYNVFNSLLAFIPANTWRNTLWRKNVIDKIANYMTSEEISQSVSKDLAEAILAVYDNRQASNKAVCTIKDIIQPGAKANLRTILTKGAHMTYLQKYIEESDMREINR